MKTQCNRLGQKNAKIYIKQIANVIEADIKLERMEIMKTDLNFEKDRKRKITILKIRNNELSNNWKHLVGKEESQIDK